jgi:hypothetical protein
MKLKLMDKPKYLPNFLEEAKAEIKKAQDKGRDVECIYINRDEAYTMMTEMQKQKTWIKDATLQSIECGAVVLNLDGIDVRMQ